MDGALIQILKELYLKSQDKLRNLYLNITKKDNDKVKINNLQWVKILKSFEPNSLIQQDINDCPWQLIKESKDLWNSINYAINK